MIAFAIIGGLFNRWRGGWLPGFLGDQTVRRMVFAAATTVWMLILLRPEINKEAVLLALLFWALSYAGWVLGWGSYMDMGRSGKTDNEFLRIPLNLFFEDTIDNLKRDFVGMTIRGLLVTIGAGIALAYWYLWPGIMYAISGLVMGIIYWLSWKAWDAGWKVKGFEGGPPLAEFVFGIWLWGTLYIWL